MKKTIIHNSQVILKNGIVSNGGVIIEGKKITKVFMGELPKSDSQIIDANGMYLSPGFIDLHVHGGGGYEVNDGKVDSIIKICETHAKYGTTSILPTVMSDSWEDMKKSVKIVREASRLITKGSNIVGINIEGPFFSVEQRGAQSLNALKIPKQEDYNSILDIWDGIKIMGAAPELDGGMELGDNLKRRGIVASIAHSNAEYNTVIEAVAHGYSHITHLYSGCSTVHRKNAYRHAGVVEAGLLEDNLTVEVIADGKHLPQALLKLIYKCKGPDKIALITDALSFAGTDIEEGTVYNQKNGIKVLFEDGVMKIPDRRSFAGSIATTNHLVKTMRDLAGVTLHECVKMASLTPANIIGISDRKGLIQEDMDADLLIFDENISVKLSMIEGNIIYNNI